MTNQTDVSSSVISDDKTKKAARYPGKKRANAPDLTELKTFLETIEATVPPSIHINGTNYPNCVLAVDFGQPLKPTKLSNEQQGELGAHLKRATKIVMNKEVNVRVSSDPQTGIWWTTASHAPMPEPASTASVAA